MPDKPNSFRNGPDEHGHFGIFGGRFVAETLMPLILDLERAYTAAKLDPAFAAEIASLHTHYVGSASPVSSIWGLSTSSARNPTCSG